VTWLLKTLSKRVCRLLAGVVMPLLAVQVDLVILPGSQVGYAAVLYL
jgi:hypothetical protein